MRARAEAEIVLTVSTRDVRSEALGATGMALPVGKGVIASSTLVFQHDYWVSTVLAVGPTYLKHRDGPGL